MLKRRLYAAAVLALVAGACKSTYSHPQDSVAAVAPGRLESAYRSLLQRPPLLQAPLTMLPRINRQQRLLPQLRQATEFVRRQIPEVATLFDADAGVDENITILLHTERVLSVLAEQWPYYPDPPTRSLRGQSIDAATVLAYAVVAHDLGKGVAVERGEGTEAQKKICPDCGGSGPEDACLD